MKKNIYTINLYDKIYFLCYNIIMKISGMQKLSMVDFDKHIACTLFTSGCNFACPFCHNSSLVYNNEPDIAEKEIFDYLYKRRNIIDSVVISGGEPTLHPDLPQFIERLKKLNLLIKLDSNGTHPEMLKYLIDNKLVDYIAMDIKNDESGYPQTIGITTNFDNIKKSIEYIMSSGIDYEFRTTLVKEFHTTQNIKNISQLIAGAKKYFLQKFVDNSNCITQNLHAIDKNTAEEFVEILSTTIPNVNLRGY